MYSMEHLFFQTASIADEIGDRSLMSEIDVGDINDASSLSSTVTIDHPCSKGDASDFSPSVEDKTFATRKNLFTREIEDPIVRLCVDGVAEIGSNGLPTGPMLLVFLQSEQRLR